jgi:hypothetical protein
LGKSFVVFGYKVEIINDSNAALIDLVLPFNITFYKTVRAKDGSQSSTGEITSSAIGNLSLERIDIGPSNSFVFYIFNQSSEAASVSLDDAATAVTIEGLKTKIAIIRPNNAMPSELPMTLPAIDEHQSDNHKARP